MTSTDGKKRILFVDDEASVLDALQRTLRRMRREWDMAFVTSGAEALTSLAQKQFDILVTDMRMPQMDGAQLVQEVRKRHPDTVRIVLSGYADSEMMIRATNAAHQFLTKPCDAEILVQTIKRSFALWDTMRSEHVQKVISGVGELPVLPQVYAELVEALTDEANSPEDLGNIVARDAAMTAKILQLVNSPFFGLRRHIGNLSEAIYYIGLDNLRGMVLSIGVFDQFSSPAVAEFALDELQEHCLRVGTIARRVASGQDTSKSLQDDSFIAGVVHDIGTLILVSHFPDEYRKAVQLAHSEKCAMVAAERSILQTSHAEIGSYLLQLWGLSDAIAEAVIYHHAPRESGGRLFSALTGVHVGNALDREILGAETAASPAIDACDAAYIDSLGLTDQVDKWRGMVASLAEAAAVT